MFISKKDINSLWHESKAKTFDWRFKEYEKSFDTAKLDTIASKIIYWIGIIRLQDIRPDKYFYSISFAEEFGNLWQIRKEGGYLRHEDGALVTPTVREIFKFNLRSIHNLLIENKNSGFAYFQICLKEMVTSEGFHQITILYEKDVNEVGFVSISPWSNMCYLFWTEKFKDKNLESMTESTIFTSELCFGSI